MKERPILFSAPMVRALLAGTKTQTRRVVKPRDLAWMDEHQGLREPCNSERCPYGKAGDRLWVRETWQGPIMSSDEWEQHGNDDPQSLPSHFNSPAYCEYAADGGPPPEFMTADDDLVCRWRPSIHMPRWASRITLEVTGVRVERLQDISEADAVAEGIERTAAGHWLPGPCDHPEWAYQQLWDQINGAGAWDANPWVWCVEFKRVEG